MLRRLIEATCLIVADALGLWRETRELQTALDRPVLDQHSGHATILPIEGGYGMWYNSLNRHQANGNSHWIRYATTQDGIQFEKPNLGLREHNGSKDNNIVLMANERDAKGRPFCGDRGNKGFCIIDAQQRPAPNTRSRYTALYLSNTPGRKSGLHLAHSEDGLHWLAYAENPVLFGWPDTYNNFFFDERSGKYVLYMRPTLRATPTDMGLTNRAMARCESNDLIHWRNEQIVLDTDDRDAPPVGTIKENQRADGTRYARGRDRQIYGMTVTPYQDLYLGFTVLYDVLTARNWLELTHSYDGIQWRREPRREPFVPVGEEGAWDSGLIVWATVGCPVHFGDYSYVYYGGSNCDHRRKIVALQDQGVLRSLGVVRVKRGRWVGYRAGVAEGYLLTKSFDLAHETISLNADAAGGTIRVEVCDERGQPHAGFGLDDSRPIRSDALACPIQFNDQSLAQLRGRKVRLRIQLSQASAYGLAFA